MMRACGLMLCASVCTAEVFYKETFDKSWTDRWVTSNAKEGLGAFFRTSGVHFGDEEINQGIKTSEDAKFYASSAKFDKAFDNKDKPLVVSFTVKHEQVCGLGKRSDYVRIFLIVSIHNGSAPCVDR